MKEDTETTTQTAASALESDLAAIRALLQQAIAISNKQNAGAETRLAAMTAATRLFSAAAKGSETIARLNGHVSQTLHTTIVEHGGTGGKVIGPEDGQSYDEWWQSLSAETQADLDRRFNEPRRKMRPQLLAEQAEGRAADRAADEAHLAARQETAGRGDPLGENPKTTSFEPTDPDDDDPFDDPEEA